MKRKKGLNYYFLAFVGIFASLMTFVSAATVLGFLMAANVEEIVLQAEGLLVPSFGWVFTMYILMVGVLMVQLMLPLIMAWQIGLAFDQVLLRKWSDGN